MGVDFYCGDITFSSSYGRWGLIRYNIIKATFNYIQDKYQKDEELYKNITDREDPNYIGDGSEYNCYKNYMIEIMEIINAGKNNLDSIYVLKNFIALCKNISYLDALIYFDIVGLYSLCNKSDCDGFYSVGNSIDICQLLDLIEPFIKIIDEDCHFAIYKIALYYLFEASVNNKRKICIC